ITPRFSTQNLFQVYGPNTEEESVSAFSENVEFGSFAEIQQDNAVALYVQPVTDHEDRPSHLRMRGVALDHFDGTTWKRTTQRHTFHRTYSYRPAFTTRLYPQTFTYRVIQPPGVTRFLFAPFVANEIRIPAQYSLQGDRP